MMAGDPLTIPSATGVPLTLTPAGPLPRACAYIIDLLIRVALFSVILLPLVYLGLIGQGSLLLLVFILEWLYPVLFEWLNRGRSPGKVLIGLRVVQAGGGSVTLGDSIVRNIVRVVDALPVGYLIGFFTSLFSHRHQRLGDWAADTLVIHDRPTPCPRASDPHLERNLTGLLGRAITVDHLVLHDAAIRQQQLNACHLQEMAQQLFPDCPEHQARQRLDALLATSTERRSP